MVCASRTCTSRSNSAVILHTWGNYCKKQESTLVGTYLIRFSEALGFGKHCLHSVSDVFVCGVYSMIMPEATTS
jgi:hypothetical protein